MNLSFYKNCIVKDRKTRKFLNFSEEQWFKDFAQLADKRLIESKDFGEKATWREKLEFSDSEQKNLSMYMKWEDAFPNIKHVSRYMENFSLSKEMLDLLI